MRSDKWANWRRQIESRIDRLWGSLRLNDPPIPLLSISKACRVKKIEFRPLLVAGGLAVDGNGFRIYVNSHKNSASVLTHRLTRDGGRTLDPRLRFTIAHELIHTFFFNLSGPVPAHYLKAQNHREIASLEGACNDGAAKILLPRHLLEPELRWAGPLNPRMLRSIQEKYAVSLETLVIRIKHLDEWTDEPGVIAIVDGDQRICQLAIDTRTRLSLRRVSEGDVISTIVRDRSLRLHWSASSQQVGSDPIRHLVTISRDRQLSLFDVAN